MAFLDGGMRGSGIAFLLSIPCLPVLVNAAEPQGKLAHVVRAVQREGDDFTFSKNLGVHLDLPGDRPSRMTEVRPSESSDGRGHAFSVILDTSSAKASPIGVVLLSRKTSEGSGLSHYFRLALAGTLAKAFLLENKLDESGKPVRGSGVATPLDVDAPEVRALLQSELDFWLKRYAKSPKKQPAAPKR